MTTNTHFETKEHYLTFRKAWSNAVNSEKAKKKLIETTSWDDTPIRVKQSGWIDGAHHIVYNMLRRRDYDRGFTMITNRHKLLNGTSPNLGLIQATTKLKHVQKWIREEANQPEPRKATLLRKEVKVQEYWATKHIETFLAPFDGTVTREMIFELEIPECKQLYRDFGPGQKVIPMILSGEAKVRTQTDLENLLKEVA